MDGFNPEQVILSLAVYLTDKLSWFFFKGPYFQQEKYIDFRGTLQYSQSIFIFVVAGAATNLLHSIKIHCISRKQEEAVWHKGKGNHKGRLMNSKKERHAALSFN